MLSLLSCRGRVPQAFGFLRNLCVTGEPRLPATKIIPRASWTRVGCRSRFTIRGGRGGSKGEIVRGCACACMREIERERQWERQRGRERETTPLTFDTESDRSPSSRAGVLSFSFFAFGFLLFDKTVENRGEDGDGQRCTCEVARNRIKRGNHQEPPQSKPKITKKKSHKKRIKKW